MLDNHPVLKDRLTACAVFSGIAIAAVSGMNLIIGGGFDFITPGNEIREVAPSQYVQVVDQPWAEQTRYVPISSNEPMFAGETVAVSDESLAGAADDASAPAGHYPVQTEEDLYREVNALYQDQEQEAAAATQYADYTDQAHDFSADDKSGKDIPDAQAY